MTNLTQTFQACHLCTFNVAAIFFGAIPTYGVLPYAMIIQGESGGVLTFLLYHTTNIKVFNPKKPTELDGNDTTTLSHHPYILCLFAAAYTNMLCVFVSCVQRVVEGSVVGSAGSAC